MATEVSSAPESLSKDSTDQLLASSSTEPGVATGIQGERKAMQRSIREQDTDS